MSRTTSNGTQLKPEEGVLEQALLVLRRRKWIVLQAVIAVPVIAFIFTSTQPTEYTATATLLFRQPPAALEESTGVVDPTREAATNGELAALPVIAEEAAKRLDNGLTGADIYGQVAVAPSTEGETAAISVTDESPEEAAEVANAYAQAYITFRRDSERGQVQEAIDLAEERLNGLSEEQRKSAQGKRSNAS